MYWIQIICSAILLLKMILFQFFRMKVSQIESAPHHFKYSIHMLLFSSVWLQGHWLVLFCPLSTTSSGSQMHLFGLCECSCGQMILNSHKISPYLYLLFKLITGCVVKKCAKTRHLYLTVMHQSTWITVEIVTNYVTWVCSFSSTPVSHWTLQLKSVMK